MKLKEGFMILVDFSSSIHRCLHKSIKDIKPKKLDGKYRTQDFIDYWKFLMFEDLFRIQREFSEFGELVLCLDDHSTEYWRREFYPEYKMQRKKLKEGSDINYEEFSYDVDIFTEYLIKNTPWKTFKTFSAEADDIILVLANEFKKEKILIYSPDKDFLQAHRYSSTIKQYSALVNKYITVQDKFEDMNEWLHEHICLGDVSDNVPRIVDDTEFSDEFLEFLQATQRSLTEVEYHDNLIQYPQKIQELYHEFCEFCKGKNFKEPDNGYRVFKGIRFGATTLKKRIQQTKSKTLEDFLKEHPLYERNFKRNYTLVMAEGIPEQVKSEILNDYNKASTDYCYNRFEEYLKNTGLSNLIPLLPANFRGEIDASFFDW